MRFLSLLVWGLVISLSTHAYNKDPFVGGPQESFYVWPAIPFIFAGDLSDFNDSHSTSRKNVRRELIEDLVQLMRHGAYASEGAPIVLEFDRVYDRHRTLSRQKLEVAFEEMFRNGVDQYYRQYEVKTRKLNFINGGDMAAIKYSLKHGEKINSVSLMAYGTYTVLNKSRIQAQINIFNTQTQDMRSFAVEGPMNMANRVIQTLALHVFDYFQKTRGPSEIRKGLTLLGTPTTHEGKLITFEAAEHACKRMGGRLPSYEEFLDIELTGPYAGGILLNQGKYILNRQNGAYLIYDRRDQRLWQSHMINDRTAYYFCIKN